MPESAIIPDKEGTSTVGKAAMWNGRLRNRFGSWEHSVSWLVQPQQRPSVTYT